MPMLKRVVFLEYAKDVALVVRGTEALETKDKAAALRNHHRKKQNNSNVSKGTNKN